MTRAKRPLDILLVEDNPGDARLVVEAMKDAAVTNTLHLATDGVDALRQLWRRLVDEPPVLPDVILLDLNLPKMSGHEMLSAVKADPVLCSIPVVVLTSSSDERDIAATAALGASHYVVKPLDRLDVDTIAGTACRTTIARSWWPEGTRS